MFFPRSKRRELETRLFLRSSGSKSLWFCDNQGKCQLQCQLPHYLCSGSAPDTIEEKEDCWGILFLPRAPVLYFLVWVNFAHQQTTPYVAHLSPIHLSCTWACACGHVQVHTHTVCVRGLASQQPPLTAMILFLLICTKCSIPRLENSSYSSEYVSIPSLCLVLNTSLGLVGSPSRLSVGVQARPRFEFQLFLAMRLWAKRLHITDHL